MSKDKKSFLPQIQKIVPPAELKVIQSIVDKKLDHLPSIRKAKAAQFMKQVNKDTQLQQSKASKPELVQLSKRPNRSAGHANQQHFFRKIDDMLARKALDENGLRIYVEENKSLDLLKRQLAKKMSKHKEQVVMDEIVKQKLPFCGEGWQRVVLKQGQLGVRQTEIGGQIEKVNNLMSINSQSISQLIEHKLYLQYLHQQTHNV